MQTHEVTVVNALAHAEACCGGWSIRWLRTAMSLHPRTVWGETAGGAGDGGVGPPSGSDRRMAKARAPARAPHAPVRRGATDGAGRKGHPLARAPAGAGWHGMGRHGRWKRLFESP